LKSHIEFAAVVRSAAGQARDWARDPPHTREIALTMWTLVQAASAFASCERQIMTALLAADSQIAASLPPLCAMGQDAAPTGAKLSEDMRQFMAEGAIDFGWMLKQPRI
jgi:hypothetical protein